jgi:NhaA family Na+:H+ antiporter
MVFAHVVIDYLLPIFFVGIGFELRQEFASGYFVVRKNIIAPSVAAILGVALPALIYFFIADHEGWAIPTATDLTLGIGILTLTKVAKNSTLRARFVALATIDDVIGLVVIVILFSAKLSVTNTAMALAGVVVTYILGKIRGNWRHLSLVAAALTVALAVESGIQTSLFGVLLGFALPIAYRKGVNNASRFFVLPAFAIAVSLLVLPAIGSTINYLVFAGIAVRPIGKLAGIFMGGMITDRVVSGRWHASIWLGVGVLGGLGLTVSILIAELTFKLQPTLFASAVLATLLAALVSAFGFWIIGLATNRRAHLSAKSL